jgi:glyoxylase-like metal-dependent hydrolase (beta-lactamase superfamily II)
MSGLAMSPSAADDAGREHPRLSPEPYVDFVIDNIRKVGSSKEHQRIILSHGHLDHFGGAAKLEVFGAPAAEKTGNDE